MEAVKNFLRPPSVQYLTDGAKSVFVPHYISNIFLSILFFLVKTVSPICDALFENCNLELKQWEWLTFLGCVIVLKNRKQVTVAEYISVACMFAKVLNLVLFYQINVPYAFIYGLVCLLHFVFLPMPTYKGPEYVTYFRGPHLKNEIARDKKVTWVICFYAAWSPPCVNFAPIFAELSSDYNLENFQFGKLDVSKFSKEAEEYQVNTSSFSKQLPTLILFQDGKEKMRRPAMSAKGTVVNYKFTKQNIVNDFEFNQIYGTCKKLLPASKKNKEQEKKEN
ncbi:Thioredoxin-related transmembrane protein 2 [Mactra antiquata]